MPTTSNLVAAMSVEELRSFSQVPADIRLKVADGLTTPTIEGANNVVYFTREKFAAGLRFLIPSLVKQFLHFTGASLALLHPNVFQILMGCSVLNLLYQLDFSGRDLFYVYFEAWVWGLFSMSAHSPWLQFVTRLPDSPKTEAKGVILVEGPLYETLGSLGIPFDMN